VQVAPTNISVLINGESGVGKESIPKIIHQFSQRKHGPYIAVNCGAIPEGTIDSELFGHEKGSFTGATDARKGYFEEANGGTIFLDEVAELPLGTQVRLLRVLETGEYIKVGSSKVQKTNVRVVAATNVDFSEAIRLNKFREDLFYRLNQVPIFMPPLRDRREDVVLLFRKFASDFAEKYKMPSLQLTPEAAQVLTNYSWPGNVRQLKNITEQMSVLEQERIIEAPVLHYYLPNEDFGNKGIAVSPNPNASNNFSEREILYKVLFDMKNDLNDLKSLVLNMMQNGNIESTEENEELIRKVFTPAVTPSIHPAPAPFASTNSLIQLPGGSNHPNHSTHSIIEESLSLTHSEKELIVKALKKHRNKRKFAAEELGISERTLYRKIKEYGITKA
jgi:transcriptional regulator with PAS, ATPase and Fis domain